MSVPYYTGMQTDVDDIRPMSMADGTFILRRILPKGCDPSGDNWMICRWPLGLVWSAVYPQPSVANPSLQWLGNNDRNVYAKDAWLTTTFVQNTQVTNPDVVQLIARKESELSFDDAADSVSAKVKFHLYDRRGIEVNAYWWVSPVTSTLHACGVIEGLDMDTMAPEVWHYDDLTTNKASLFEEITDEADAGYRLTLGVYPSPELAVYSYLILGATLSGYGGTVTDYGVIVKITDPPGIQVSIPAGYSMEPGEDITFLSKIVRGGVTDTASPGVSGRVELHGKKSDGTKEVLGGADVDAEDFTDGAAEKTFSPEYAPNEGPGDFTGYEGVYVKNLDDPEERDGKGGPNPGPVPGQGEPPPGWTTLGQSALDSMTYPGAVIVTTFGVFGSDVFPSGEIPFLMLPDGTQNGRPCYHFGWTRGHYEWLGEMYSYWEEIHHQAPSGYLTWEDNEDGTGYWELRFTKRNDYGSSHHKGKFALTADAEAANIPAATLDGYPTATEADKGSWLGSGNGRWYVENESETAQPVQLQIAPIAETDQGSGEEP